MKVMSWNTLFGGLDGGDERRFKLQAETIADVKPDILLIQEAKRFELDGGRQLYRVEKVFRMRGFVAVAPHTGQNTAIFIRDGVEPVAFSSDSVHFHHAAAVATLRVPGFDRPVTFVSVHLCPVGVPMRLIEAANLISYAEPEGLALVGGDFNSISPYNAEPGWGALPLHHKARYTAPDGETADRRVLATLYNAGFIDIAHILDRHATPTVPGAAFPDAEFVHFRADYFLTSKALSRSAKSYAVIRDDRTDNASDHYPIVAEFEPALGA